MPIQIPSCTWSCEGVPGFEVWALHRSRPASNQFHTSIPNRGARRLSPLRVVEHDDRSISLRDGFRVRTNLGDYNGRAGVVTCNRLTQDWCPASPAGPVADSHETHVRHGREYAGYRGRNDDRLGVIDRFTQLN